jgi:hypothetical protein
MSVCALRLLGRGQMLGSDTAAALSDADIANIVTAAVETAPARVAE